jgi:Family of unknown function (DUF6492)
MTQKTSIITVSCIRDLPMLELQGQSIFNYLDTSCPVYIIVNEDNDQLWFEYFNQHIRHYYQNHILTIVTKKEFVARWDQWIPHHSNPWAVGWETQQVLKLFIALQVNTPQYLILDSQNFLIKSWSPSVYDSDKVPARPGRFIMPIDIWTDYSEKLNLTFEMPSEDTMALCTPIFVDTEVVKQLINEYGGELSFATWFKSASKIKSEFILYLLWLEKLGGSSQFHNMIIEEDDWANPYLRDCKSEEEFKPFIEFVGVHAPHSWVSINHRAWGNMTNEQYQRLCTKLKTYKLVPQFDDYRTSYVDLKI